MPVKTSQSIGLAFKSIPPRLDHHVTFRLNSDTLQVLDECTRKINLSSEDKISRASTIRLLINIHHEACKLGAEQRQIALNDETRKWLDQETTEKASLAISEQQRVTIRKLEFDIQQSDWSIAIDRNDTVQLLILNYGNYLKDNLPSSLSY